MIRSRYFWPVYVDNLRLLCRGSMFAVGIAWSGSAQCSNIHEFIPNDLMIQQDPLLLWTKILSNAGITAACLALFLALIHFIRNKKELGYPIVFWLLGLCLVAFGLLHIMKIWSLFHPLYWILASIEACTAAIAILSAMALWPLVPKTLKLRSTEELETAHQKLRESEEQFHLLISGIKDYAIIMLDPQGTIMTWNDGAERIQGYKEDEIVGWNFSSFFSSEDKEQNGPQWVLDMARKDGRYEEERLRIRKDGSQFWAHIIITAIYDHAGQLTGFAKVTRDITEKRRISNALQEQAALLDLSNDAIIVRDQDGTIRYFNRGAEKMYGYTDSQALDKKSHELLKTEFPKPLLEIEQEILIKGRWDGELIHYTQDGRRLIIESRQTLKTDMKGKPIGVLEINTDITDRKEAEQKQFALAEMERVNAELEQFASVASHDLQEPLRAIAGCLQILEKTYKGRLDRNADELIHYAVDGAQRMRALINDLLSLSRVNSEEISYSATEVPKVLEQVKTNLATAIEESKATIRYGRLPALTANSTLLTQLFQNLISNAIKFRSDSPPEIFVDARRKNGQWLFSVRDNGIGFDQAYANRIFQPFKRLHAKDKYPGTGIGLPICKRIIERHGGKIWVESQPGKGTTFHFSITERGDKK